MPIIEYIHHMPALTARNPQVSALILSALQRDELKTAALDCWAELIRVLEDEYMSVLIEITFFIIAHYYESFDWVARPKAMELVQYLLNERSSLIRDHVQSFASLRHLPDMAAVEATLQTLRDSSTRHFPGARLRVFIPRLQHENWGVVIRALIDLAAYMRGGDAESFFRGPWTEYELDDDRPEEVQKDLMRALLDCSAKYSGSSNSGGGNGSADGSISSSSRDAGPYAAMARLCVECIGLVGCLDPNQVETVREQGGFILLQNFSDTARYEVTDFVMFMLDKVLVKAFVSAVDPSFQGFLAYTMQELLGHCGFSAAVAHVRQRTLGSWEAFGRELHSPQNTHLGRPEDLYKQWMDQLSESSRVILTPFLTSMYRVEPIEYKPAVYPLFRPGRPYASWLRALTIDLLHQGRSFNAKTIFKPLSRVVRVKNPVVAEFLLPYLVMHVVSTLTIALNGPTNIRKATEPAEAKRLVRELQEVLEYQVPDDATPAERENMKLYYEASHPTYACASACPTDHPL